MLFRVLALAWLAGAPLFAASSMHLKNRRDELLGDQTLQSPQRRLRAGRSHYLIQFASPVSAAMRSELARRGAVVTAAIPDRAVMVVAGDRFTPFGMNVAYFGRLVALDKISDTLPDDEEEVTALVEFHADLSAAEMAPLLANVAVLPVAGLLARHALVRASSPALRELAQWDEVAYIFPASNDLQLGLPVTGCVGALTQSGAVPQYALVGHGWTPDVSGAVRLSYVFDKLTSKISADLQKREIERAFAEWAKYAPLYWSEAVEAQAPRTVDIVFASGRHGDGYAFDGPGGSLAHTFYPAPPNSEFIAGDMHFDADEPWHTGTSLDLFTVALHETGHALGLGHSDDPEAVMYPYYRFGALLGASDIAAIRALYGAAAVIPQIIPQIIPQVTVLPPVAPPPVPIPGPLPLPPAPALAVSIDGPSAQTTTSSAVSLGGRVWNFMGALQVTWQTDGAAAGVAQGGELWSIAAVPLHSGSNTVTVTAIDASHRSAAQSVQILRTVADPAPDTTAPQLSILNPSTSIVSTTEASITISGVAWDNVAVASVVWEAPGGRGGSATGTAAWSALVPLYVGTNPITVRAFDAAGNSRFVALTVVRQ